MSGVAGCGRGGSGGKAGSGWNGWPGREARREVKQKEIASKENKVKAQKAEKESASKESTAKTTEKSAKESETRAKDEAHQADASERLYLRNVLLRYMETEDHTAMFPVVAMCLRLTAQEVEAIHERRAKRERERRPAWRIGLFG